MWTWLSKAMVRLASTTPLGCFLTLGSRERSTHDTGEARLSEWPVDHDNEDVLVARTVPLESENSIPKRCLILHPFLQPLYSQVYFPDRRPHLGERDLVLIPTQILLDALTDGFGVVLQEIADLLEVVHSVGIRLTFPR